MCACVLELVSQLQAAEARCRGLEKQLDYMRWMMEKAQQDKNTLAEKQVETKLAFPLGPLLAGLTQ